MRNTFRVSLLIIGTVCILMTAGCSSHTDAQVPAGMKVGPPLTDAQKAAIQKKYNAKMGN